MNRCVGEQTIQQILHSKRLIITALTIQRDAMLSFMSAMAEAQTMAMKEAQAAGIENAKANNPLAYRGRKPSYTFDQVLEVMEKFEHGIGVNQIAREVGLSKFAVSRITRNPEAARERLYLWEDLKNTDSVS